MIEPLVQELEWMRSLSELPAWAPPEHRVILIAPHPDDETLGAGGLIAALRGIDVEVVVVAVTDGENAYPEDVELDCGELGALRAGEQTVALARLGVMSERIARLRLPDRDVASHEAELIERLKAMITKETHIIAPWRGDFHPDHEACGRAAEEVARQTGARLSSYFFWTWHRGYPRLLDGLPLRRFELSDADVRAKKEALSEHRSQLVHPMEREGDPRTAIEPILPERLLAPARRTFEVFLDA